MSKPEVGSWSPPDAAGDARPFFALFLLLGVLLVVLGAVALAHVTLAGTVTMWLFGVLLLVSAAMHALETFLAMQWRGSLLHASAAVLDAVVGLVLVLPGTQQLAESVVTLLLAIYLLADGALHSWDAALLRFRGWVPHALSGLASILLGALLLADWPKSGYWLIGLYVGISLVLRGAAWIGLALALLRPGPEGA